MTMVDYYYDKQISTTAGINSWSHELKGLEASDTVHSCTNHWRRRNQASHLLDARRSERKRVPNNMKAMQCRRATEYH
jgi:hypothetical protein